MSYNDSLVGFWLKREFMFIVWRNREKKKCFFTCVRVSHFCLVLLFVLPVVTSIVVLVMMMMVRMRKRMMVECWGGEFTGECLVRHNKHGVRGHLLSAAEHGRRQRFAGGEHARRQRRVQRIMLLMGVVVVVVMVMVQRRRIAWVMWM